MDESGRPSFNALQNYSPGGASVFNYVFDVLVLGGRSLVNETLERRVEFLKTKVMPKLREPIRPTEELQGTVAELFKAVATFGFEGLVAKRRSCLYEAANVPAHGAKRASIRGKNLSLADIRSARALLMR